MVPWAPYKSPQSYTKAFSPPSQPQNERAPCCEIQLTSPLSPEIAPHLQPSESAVHKTPHRPPVAAFPTAIVLHPSYGIPYYQRSHRQQIPNVDLCPNPGVGSSKFFPMIRLQHHPSGEPQPPQPPHTQHHSQSAVLTGLSIGINNGLNRLLTNTRNNFSSRIGSYRRVPRVFLSRICFQSTCRGMTPS